MSRGRLVVASNRLPFATSRGGSLHPSPGGLVSALEPALRRLDGTWVGWPGGRLRNAEDLDALSRTVGYRFAPVPLSHREVRRFYLGFANGTLWPLLHSLPTRIELDREDWPAYEQVNRRFAAVALENTGPDDLLWIHDYQLMRAALHVRHMRPDARIAFFLHVPFPHYDLFRILPWDRELLRGLLACDLVGFHCAGYASNFLDCAERLLGTRVDRAAGKIEHGQRTIAVGAFPLGIDYECFRKWAEEAPPRETESPRVVLGVDRLDYTKGLPEKILAFERLLELHPEHRERVMLLQIAELSRDQLPEYQRLKRQVDELVGRVNGRFSTSRWTPIRYVHQSVPREQLAGLYRDAEIALVTPLRDGMNLVAKEYVACQIGDPGVLILSELAGAAESMREAVLVNPYDADRVARALHDALVMDLAERTARMLSLQHRERRSDVHVWLERFLERARTPVPPIRPFSPEDYSAWLGAATEGQRLALFLDFDGTLAEIASDPKGVRLSDTMRELLATCAARDDTDVAIVSGRALADLRNIAAAPGVILVGNHGLEMEGAAIEPFRHPDLDVTARGLDDVAKRLVEDCPPGAWIEEKGASLTLHYRSADPSTHAALAARGREVAHRCGFQARPALCAVEIRPLIDWDKGDAVLHILRSLHGRAWAEGVEVIYAGDDETDEDAFRVLQGLGVTFRVGVATHATLATHRLPNVLAVEALVRWAANRPSASAPPEPA